MRFFMSLHEYTLSSTRGTTQKIVDFSSPTSSINNLTSYNHWVNDDHIPNPKFNYYIQCSFHNDKYTTYTHPTPETYLSTMPFECLLNDPIKYMKHHPTDVTHFLNRKIKYLILILWQILKIELGMGTTKYQKKQKT